MPQAPSTCIQFFLSVAFSLWIQKFPLPHIVYLNEFACPHAFRFTLEKLGLRIVQPYQLVYYLVRDWAQLGHCMWSKNIWISCPQDIIYFFHSRERIKNIWIRCEICRMHVDRSGTVYEKKKLQIKKYLDMCGQRLRLRGFEERNIWLGSYIYTI